MTGWIGLFVAHLADINPVLQFFVLVGSLISLYFAIRSGIRRDRQNKAD